MRKFKGIEDLQENLVTRDGRKILEVKLFNTLSAYPIIGVVEGSDTSIISWNLGGEFIGAEKNNLDLFVDEKKFYANVYRLSNGRVSVGVIRDSIESCEEHRKESDYQKFERVIEL